MLLIISVGSHGAQKHSDHIPHGSLRHNIDGKEIEHQPSGKHLHVGIIPKQQKKQRRKKRCMML
jgi:hypothetical protein